jgi:hypothetical protein
MNAVFLQAHKGVETDGRIKPSDAEELAKSLL